MNELEIKQLIEKDKELLEQRTELKLEEYDKRYEIKEIEDQIIKISTEKHNYKELKKEKLKSFACNMLQFAAIFGVTEFGLSLNFLNINPATLHKIYSFFSILYGSLGGILLIIYQDELKDYRKMIGEEYFDKKILNDIETTKEVKEEELKKINKRMNVNSRKLDKIYNMSINEVIVSPRNNEYSVEEDVKSKQKIIEK